MKTYKTDADLQAESKLNLIDIIKYQHAILEIPEIKLWLKAESIRRKVKNLQCCLPSLGCLQVQLPLDKTDPAPAPVTP